MECVPRSLAEEVTQALAIPTLESEPEPAATDKSWYTRLAWSSAITIHQVRSKLREPRRPDPSTVRRFRAILHPDAFYGRRVF